jgi:DNA-binding MarR family transcriptional regulator
MDYLDLAKELLLNLQSMQKLKRHKFVLEGIQGELLALYRISQEGRAVLPGEISDNMNISTARIASVLNSLEGKNYITREIDKDDRRQILVKITKEGESFIKEQEQRVTREIVNALEMLGENDAKEYIRITGKLANLIMNTEN